jgi:hypothetical protein
MLPVNRNVAILKSRNKSPHHDEIMKKQEPHVLGAKRSLESPDNNLDMPDAKKEKPTNLLDDDDDEEDSDDEYDEEEEEEEERLIESLSNQLLSLEESVKNFHRANEKLRQFIHVLREHRRQMLIPLLNNLGSLAAATLIITNAPARKVSFCEDDDDDEDQQ